MTDGAKPKDDAKPTEKPENASLNDPKSYQISDPQEFTMIELAEKVRDLTGSRSELIRKPLPMDDPRQRCPDISLAKRELDWQPTIELEEGLAKTIAYFEQALKTG